MRLPVTDFFDARELYRYALDEVIRFGHTVSPRGRATREILGARLRLEDPDHNIPFIQARKLNFHFMVAEWLWIMTGQHELEMIAPYNGQISHFSDDGIAMSGAYGPRFVNQLPYVLDKLRSDRDSRQAVISIWQPNPRPSKDIPCTVSLQYLLRDDQLHAITYMRSNDLWLGFPYDLFTFTQLQRYIAMLLDVQVGRYHHHVGSLHLYEEHLVKAEVARNEWNAEVVPPDIPNFDVQQLCQSPLLTPMTKYFRTMYDGVTRLGTEHKVDMASWSEMNAASMPAPWDDYMRLLAHRFHKRDELLPEIWRLRMGLGCQTS